MSSITSEHGNIVNNKPNEGQNWQKNDAKHI